jgi:hypothetical protein
MKEMSYKFFKKTAFIPLIPGTLLWGSGIVAFLIRLFEWYKTGQWTKLAFIEFVPTRLIDELNARFPGNQNEMFWIVDKEIILLFLGFGLLLILSFSILIALAKKCEERAKTVTSKKIVADRLKKLAQ